MGEPIPHVPEPQGLAANSGILAPGDAGGSTAGSGSVQAADGSTIRWTTSAGGTITAVGAAGRQMVIQPIHRASGVLTEQVAFSASASTYLTLAVSIDESRRSTTARVSGGDSQAMITITFSSATRATAVASGSFGGNAFRWSGSVNLLASPSSLLEGVAGFDRNAFNAQLAEASYFLPVRRFLTSQASSQSPVPSSNLNLLDEGWGKFLLKGGIAGAAALLIGPVSIPTFLFAAGGEMLIDDVTEWPEEGVEWPPWDDDSPSGDGGTGSSPVDAGPGDESAGPGNADGGDGGGGDGGGGDGGGGGGGPADDDNPPRQQN